MQELGVDSYDSGSNQISVGGSPESLRQLPFLPELLHNLSHSSLRLCERFTRIYGPIIVSLYMCPQV